MTEPPSRTTGIPIERWMSESRNWTGNDYLWLNRFRDAVFELRTLEAENERLREACELVVAQDDWRDTVSISAKAYDACNAALSEPCHICGRRRDEPGEMYCSAAHPLAPDSDEKQT